MEGVCQPVRITTDPSWASFLAVDGAHVYLASQKTGLIERRVLADMGSPHVLADGQSDVQGLTAADGLVIWSKGATKGPLSGSIAAVGTFGGAPWTIRDKLSASGVGYRAGWLYFTDFEQGAWRTQLQDGLDKGNTELLDGTTMNGRGITEHDGTVYWAEMNGGNRILARELGPGHETLPLATGQDWPMSIHVDDQRVFWISRVFTQPLGELRARSKGDPTPRDLVAQRPIVPSSLAGNATSLFWAEDDGHVYRLAKLAPPCGVGWSSAPRRSALTQLTSHPTRSRTPRA